MFLFIITLEPYLMVQMGSSQCFKEGRRTILMEINCTDEGSKRVKCRWGRGHAKETVGNMPRNQDTFNTQTDPILKKIG